MRPGFSIEHVAQVGLGGRKAGKMASTTTKRPAHNISTLTACRPSRRPGDDNDNGAFFKDSRRTAAAKAGCGFGIGEATMSLSVKSFVAIWTMRSRFSVTSFLLLSQSDLCQVSERLVDGSRRSTRHDREFFLVEGSQGLRIDLEMRLHQFGGVSANHWFSETSA